MSKFILSLAYFLVLTGCVLKKGASNSCESKIEDLQELIEGAFGTSEELPYDQNCLQLPIETELHELFDATKNCLSGQHVTKITKLFKGKVVNYESIDENQYLIITGKCYNDTVIREGIYFDIRTDKQDLIKSAFMGDEEAQSHKTTKINTQ